MSSVSRTMATARVGADTATAGPPLLVACLVALAVFVGMDLRIDPTRLMTSLGDADDATRLVQVRDLLASGRWFDRTLARFGAPDPLLSHWSRLIDLPIAALLKGFGLVLPEATATLAARVAWPLTIFFGLLIVLARHARMHAGAAGLLAALGLAVYAHTGIMQFVPGRIDHHNAMILGLVGGTLLLAESFERPRIGAVAGLLLGLGVAVGYEGLGLTVAVVGAAGLIACWTGRGLDGVASAAAVLAATLVVTFLATVAPSAWSVVHCDALSLNVVAFAVAGATGLVVARRWPHADARLRRLAAAGGSAGVGLALFAASEPACLAGPFAQVDPMLRATWLPGVQENLDAVQAFASMPLVSLQFYLTALIGVAAAAWRWRTTRAAGDMLILIALVAATAMTVLHLKIMPYATFLAVVPLAVLIGTLPAIGSASALSTRLLAFLAVNQHSILALLMAGAGIAASAPTGAPAGAARDWAATNQHLEDCTATANVTPLAALAPGLIVTDIDLGAYIVALTPHRVLSAPYHRLDASILLGERIRSAAPEIAETHLRAIGASYVAICTGLPPRASDTPTLAGLLHAGRAPAYLAPVPLAGATPLKLWRLTPPQHLPNG